MFDEWRRAHGPRRRPASAGPAPARSEATVRRGPSLPAHLERVVLRLTSRTPTGCLDAGFDDLLDRVSRELDACAGGAAGREATGARRAAGEPRPRAARGARDGWTKRSRRLSLAARPRRSWPAFAPHGCRSVRARAGSSHRSDWCANGSGLPTIAYLGQCRPPSGRTLTGSPCSRLATSIPLTIEKPAAGGRMIARVRPARRAGRRRHSRRAGARAHRARRQGRGIRRDGRGRRGLRRSPRSARPIRCAAAACTRTSPTPRQLELKAQVIADAFARIGRIAPAGASVPVAPSPEDGYRMRARLHVRGGRVGFFREGHARGVRRAATRQLLPATLDALDRLVAAMRSLGLDAVREIELAENLDASHRVVHLDARRGLDAAIAGTAGRHRRPDRAVVARHGARGDVQPARCRSRCDGDPPVSLEAPRAGVLSGQPLPAQAARRARRRSGSGRAAHVLDLYAGVGLFAVAGGGARGARVDRGRRRSRRRRPTSRRTPPRPAARVRHRPSVGRERRAVVAAPAHHRTVPHRRSSSIRRGPACRATRSRGSVGCAPRASFTCRATSPRSRATPPPRRTAGTRSTRRRVRSVSEHAARRNGRGLRDEV